MSKRHGAHRSGPPRVAGILAVLLSAMLATQDLAAQPPAAEPGNTGVIEAGTRVRIITSSSPQPIVGEIDALEPESVQLVKERNHTLVSIPRETILRVERSRVRRSGGQRAAVGMIAGGLLGAVVGVVTTENAEETNCDPRSSPFCLDLDGLPSNKVMAGIAGFAIGALGGALVSLAIIPAESWEDASLPTLTAGADSNGAYVALRIPLLSGGRQ